MAEVVPPSTALAFVTKMSEKRKATSPFAAQVENGQKTVTIEETYDVKSQLVKDEQIVYICHNVRCAHIRVCTVGDNADRITESAK
jgi:hypothetical protein